jgi:integrase
VRARMHRRLPVVRSEGEVKAVRQRLEAEPGLVVGLLDGSGLWLMEALRLRVKDLDVEQRELTMRDGKGGRDRRTLLPERLIPGLQNHLLKVIERASYELLAMVTARILPLLVPVNAATL